MVIKKNQLCIFWSVVFLLYVLSSVASPANVTNLDPAFKITTITTFDQLKNRVGWRRRGMFGHGSFLGYSFGKICQNNPNEMLRKEGPIELIEISNRVIRINPSIRSELKSFETVSLLLEKYSRRLVQVKLSSYKESPERIDRLHSQMKNEIEYTLGITFKKIRCESVFTNNIVSHVEAEDEKFKASLIVNRIVSGEHKIEVSVASKLIMEEEGKQVVKPIDPIDDDLTIDVGDL